MFLYDPTFVLLLPGLMLALYAQHKVHSTFAQYLRVPARSGKTGAQVARELLDRMGLSDVPVQMTPGHLTDHYDPRQRVLRLSRDVYEGRSLAALAVAAHETGHAVQHQRGYVPLNIRNSLFPVASIGSQLAFPLFFLGFLFAADVGYALMTLGIYLFLAALAFQLVTLPVEFDASSRALQLLSAGGYLAQDERPGARAVLQAAALTYVAAVAVALLQVVRLLVLRNSRR